MLIDFYLYCFFFFGLFLSADYFLKKVNILGVPLAGRAAFCPFCWAGCIRWALAIASRSFKPCGEDTWVLKD
jgi:hypothetical protein